MVHEVETAAAASAGSFFRWRRAAAHAVPLGTPCANCATPLQGPWCHACGQLGEDFHRSVGHLVIEAFEGFFHFDGRIWRTLPDLVAHPARLTRAYLDGHRAPQIPPLRLFLVVLLLVFLAGSTVGFKGVNVVGGVTLDDKGVRTTRVPVATLRVERLNPAQRAAMAKSLGDVKVSFGGDSPAATSWFQQRLKRVLENPELFRLVIEQWSERFAFLMLPIATLLLTVLFAFRRGVYVFDHTIFALHSLSFQGLLLSLLFVVARLGDWTGWLAWAAPVHLFLHMRGTYGTGVVGTLLRMSLLFVGSLIGFVSLAFGLVWVGLSAIGTG